jgi:hypothetical protein
MASRLRQKWWAKLSPAERFERLREMQNMSLSEYNERREAEAAAWAEATVAASRAREATEAARAEEGLRNVPPLPPLRDLVAERDEAERKRERDEEIRRLREAEREQRAQAAERERHERAARRREDEEAARERFRNVPRLPPLLDPVLAEPPAHKRKAAKKRRIAKPRPGRPDGSEIKLKPEALKVIDEWPEHRRREGTALHRAVSRTYDHKKEKAPSLSTVQRRAKERWSKSN